MRILIVEDEPTLGKQLKSTLEATGYAVDLSTDGEDGHFMGSTEEYDAVILDLGLPEIDGLTVLGMWRKEGRKFPVLVLTARDSWSDKVAGLDAGADDYLAKPFQTEELLARVHGLIRRSSGQSTAKLGGHGLEIDPASATVTIMGKPVELTQMEYRLLFHLVTNAGKAVPARDRAHPGADPRADDLHHARGCTHHHRRRPGDVRHQRYEGPPGRPRPRGTGRPTRRRSRR